MFKEIKNRDAWATIRGFVYQVDRTVLRWLELNDNEVLELEKGEDIDIISQNFEKQEILRKLEQVKHRKSNITLNQEVVLEILLNFFVHKSNNPSKKILFRFVTNTVFGIERPSLFSDGKGGIEVWIELFKSNSFDSTDKRLITIKTHLLKKIKEKIVDDSTPYTDKEKLSQNNWKNFKTYLENDDQLIEFIQDFEWSLKNDDNVQIGESIKEKLLDDNVVIDRIAAETLYSRLFLYVFKLLCKSSLKQLDKGELLNQVSLPELSSTDQNLLNLLNNFANILDSKVSELEVQLSTNTADITALIGDVELITNSDTVFNFRLKTLSVKPPSLIRNGSLRKEKVADILKMFEKYSWIGFQGINGTGKSQLASLICLEFENFRWLDLRTYMKDIEKTTCLLESFLSIISNCKIVQDRQAWIEEVVKSIPDNTLIILNDIPRTRQDSPISELLILLTNAAVDSNLKLLTTSNHKIHNSVKQLLDTNLFAEYYDFEFTDEELVEYLIKSGANETISSYISLIASLSHRNPRLISAIIYHLRAINWGENSEELFDVILNKEFSSEILDDAQLSINKFIPDVESRELLYRLSLIHWNFNFQEVKTISDIEEKITHPNEKLQDLVNIWIQEQSDKAYQVSPLIYDIGEKNLPEDTIQNVHLAIAKSIISNKKIDQISASKSITSFIKGKDYNNAGIVLLNVFQSANSTEEIKQLENWGYLNYWSDLDIPKEMSVVLRSYIRYEQIRLGRSLDRDTTLFLNRLEEYLAEESLSSSESILVHCLNLVNFHEGDNAKYWTHLNEVLMRWKDLKEPFKDVINVEMVVELLWIPVQNLKSDYDIKNWLASIGQVEKVTRINFFDNDISQTAISIISSKVANSENHKEEKHKNWVKILNQLDSLASYFNERNLEVLEAVVLKEIIALEFQINKNPSIAVEKTKLNAEKFSTSEAKYLLFENIGKLYYNNNNIKESNLWLFRALEFDCTDQVNYIDTLIYGASSISETDSSKSVELCKCAVELAGQREDYQELDYIKILSELAIAYWINGNFYDSFESFENVVNRLFKTKSKHLDEYWIRLFSWTGHALGYISASVSSERVPQFARDGGEYVKPYQGLLSFNTKDLSDLYKPKNDPIIMVHLAIFSDGVNNIQKAYYWSLRAFDLSRKTGDQQIFLMISGVCSQYSLINFKIEEAFESYLLFSAVTSHLKGDAKERHASLSEIKLADIFTNKPSENWNTAEDTTVSFAIIPLFIMVLNAQLDNWENKNDHSKNFRYTIENYIQDASDKNLWELVLELSDRILEKNITERELIDRSNTFSSQERKNLQIICILGVIYSTKDHANLLKQIINIFPYLTKILGTYRSVIKFVIIPFIKNRSLHVLKETFVGSKNDLERIANEIENVDLLDKNAIQKMLQPVVEELEIKIIDNRKSWLYDYEEI